MTQFPVNPNRLDPYKNFKFRVFFNDQEVPDVIAVSPFGTRQPDTDTTGGTSMTEASGHDTFEPIKLERGDTHDSSFADWMALILPLANQPGGLDDFSAINRDIRIEQLDESGNLVAAWQARGCRPIEYHQPKKTGVGPERLFLEYDALERTV